MDYNDLHVEVSGRKLYSEMDVREVRFISKQFASAVLLLHSAPKLGILN